MISDHSSLIYKTFGLPDGHVTQVRLGGINLADCGGARKSVRAGAIAYPKVGFDVAQFAAFEVFDIAVRSPFEFAVLDEQARDGVAHTAGFQKLKFSE